MDVFSGPFIILYSLAALVGFTWGRCIRRKKKAEMKRLSEAKVRSIGRIQCTRCKAIDSPKVLPSIDREGVITLDVICNNCGSAHWNKV